jgi:hypothetical protein
MSLRKHQIVDAYVRFVPEADVSRVKEEDTAADFTSRHYLWIMGFHMF